MESWRMVWRDGFAPGLPTDGLRALADALRTDDPRLIQGAIIVPPPLECVKDWPVEGGCALGYMGASVGGGFGACTVGEAEGFFAKSCFDADQKLKEAAACRWFLNWFDDTPRGEMRRELIVEVERELDRRAEAETVIDSHPGTGDEPEDDDPDDVDVDYGEPVGFAAANPR